MSAWDYQRVMRLVPEARDFEGCTWMEDPSDWVHVAGSPGQAIAYGYLLWPAFVEYDGCVFRRDEVDDGLRQWYADHCRKLNRRQVESLGNHLHVYDLFRDEAQPTPEQAEFLGRLMREMWIAKLAVQFPGRRFEVVLVDAPEPGGDGWVDFQVTFWTAEPDVEPGRRT